MSALDRQVGGTHYTAMALQPNEFAMRNGWDSTSYATLKYLSRHGGKGGYEDLCKAHHYVEIRCELLPRTVQETGYIIQNGRLFAPLGTLAVYNSGIVTMAAYVQINQIRPEEAQALFTLERWDMDWYKTDLNLPNQLQAEISSLAHKRYGAIIQ
jgi:hypothetical protein